MSGITVITNGIVFDAEMGCFINDDVYIRENKIITKGDVQDADTLTRWDAKGRYVSPGLIDMHVHVFQNHAQIGVNADRVGIQQGVTTLVDAGSSGLEDFSTFKSHIIEKSKTEIRAFLNVSTTGLVAGLHELTDPNMLMEETDWMDLLEKEPSIVGLKARMSQSVVGNQGVKPLQHARQLADKADVPIMVHIGSPPPPLQEIFPLLKDGDIVTHAFHGKKGGIIDESGSLIPEAADALARGVRFDVGHGTSSFSFDTIQRFKKKYVSPFTISTDVYEANIDTPVGSLMDTMSKLIAVGYRLEDVLLAVTLMPAQVLSLSKHGSLKAGNLADITVFELTTDQQDTLVDSYGESMIAQQRLVPYATWKSGVLEYKRS